MRVWNILVGISLLSLILGSCASKKDVIYLQDIESIVQVNDPFYFENKVEPGDILSIRVSAEDPEVTKPFNLYGASDESANAVLIDYLISKDGTFNFPVLGEINAKDRSTDELEKELEEKLKKYIVTPEVTIRIKNFKVTVLGSVTSPGTFQIENSRVTLLEALGMAGDLNIYGKRDDILLLREIDGIKTYKKIDITKAYFLNSDYYYLRQNDVIIVSPNFYEVQRSASNPNNRLYISLASLTISIIVLLTR